jgi:hypothetical protein
MSALTGERLTAVAAMWRRSGKQLVASFDGRSMLPSIQPGQPLTIDCSPFAPAAGDVIAFVHEGQVVVHRVVAAHGWIVTRGDANRLVDLPIGDSAVMGRVIAPVTQGRITRVDRFFVALLRLSFASGVRAIRLLIWLRRNVWARL